MFTIAPADRYSDDPQPGTAEKPPIFSDGSAGDRPLCWADGRAVRGVGRVPEWLWCHPGLDADDVRMYAVVDTFCTTDIKTRQPVGHAKVEEIGKRFGRSPIVARRRLHRLQAAGALKIEDRYVSGHQRANLYRLAGIAPFAPARAEAPQTGPADGGSSPRTLASCESPRALVAGERAKAFDSPAKDSPKSKARAPQRVNLHAQPEPEPPTQRLLSAGNEPVARRPAAAGDEPHPASPGSDPVVHHPDAARLCGLLAELVRANGFTPAKLTRSELDQCTRLLSKDGPDGSGRDLDEVEAVLAWCQAEVFWRAIVHTMRSFRRHFDKMRGQCQRVGDQRGRRWSATDVIAAAIAKDPRLNPPAFRSDGVARSPSDRNAQVMAEWRQWRERGTTGRKPTPADVMRSVIANDPLLNPGGPQPQTSRTAIDVESRDVSPRFDRSPLGAGSTFELESSSTGVADEPNTGEVSGIAPVMMDSVPPVEVSRIDGAPTDRWTESPSAPADDFGSTRTPTLAALTGFTPRRAAPRWEARIGDDRFTVGGCGQPAWVLSNVAEAR
jgi:hypothetical protein